MTSKLTFSLLATAAVLLVGYSEPASAKTMGGTQA